jgi:hypothetical protein
MGCVNPHITNEMLVCINSKLGHVHDWILLFSESIQSISVWICAICWIKFSWACNHHFSHRNWEHCPTGLLKSSIQVNVPITGLAFVGLIKKSHVIILNFSMEFQSTYVSILVLVTTWIRIQQCIHNYSVYHEGSVIVASIIASYPYITSSDYRIIHLLLGV